MVALVFYNSKLFCSAMFLFVFSSLATPEMNKLRQSLRRKKPTYVPEASRPHQWGADEESVRRGKCSFPVRVSDVVSAAVLLSLVAFLVLFTPPSKE